MDIYKYAKEILNGSTTTKHLDYVTYGNTNQQCDTIKYDFNQCEQSEDPISRVNPIFHTTLKAMRGDYR